MTRQGVPAEPPTGSPPPRRREDARSDDVLPAYCDAGGRIGPTTAVALARAAGSATNWLAFTMSLSLGHRTTTEEQRRAVPRLEEVLHHAEQPWLHQRRVHLLPDLSDRGLRRPLSRLDPAARQPEERLTVGIGRADDQDVGCTSEDDERGRADPRRAGRQPVGHRRRRRRVFGDAGQHDQVDGSAVGVAGAAQGALPAEPAFSATR